jgi:hypothetical protein
VRGASDKESFVRLVVGVTAAPKSALTQNLADREFCLILADFRKWPGDRRRLLPKERVPVGVEIVSFLAKTYREMLSDGAINSNRADLELDFKLPGRDTQRKLSQSEMAENGRIWQEKQPFLVNPCTYRGAKRALVCRNEA